MHLYKQVNNRVELCIFPWLEKEMRKLFDAEIRKGEREVLEDGRIFFAFEVSEDKASLLHIVSDWIQPNRDFRAAKEG